MTTMKDEAIASWRDVQSAAKNLRDSADTLLSTINGAINSNSTSLEAELDRIKERVLAEFGAASTTTTKEEPTAPRATTPRRRASSFKCEVCGHAAKNKAGLSIHMGRRHGTKAERAAQEASDAAAAAPQAESPQSESSDSVSAEPE